MANNIDERIVEMRFDNKDFERGVSDTIDSLDKLKKGLDFEDSVKGFDELDKAVEKVDLNPLEKSVEAVKVKFSALEVIAITALSRITNQAMEAGEKLVKSFTVDPIAAGFDKYESKVASVQRILNSSSENTMAGVEAALDKIEWFTNETSYQYDQMVSTLGSFAASGIKLQDATNMIVGIADAAAISGVNAKDASHAMLGFQRAISSGYLSLGIWNSYLKTAGMQSQVFIDKCIEMGLKTGTLRKNLKGVAETAKGTEVTLASFASTLNEKWLDAETLTETTKAFSIASDELYAIMQNEDFDMVGQAIDKYGEKLDQFSLKAFQAGQETKTWGDTVEYVRGTVAQGWSKTFELIFGNYTTATKFFSSLVEDMYTIFVAGGEARNDFLNAWATGIRYDKEEEQYFQARQGVQVAFLNGLINTARGIAKIVENVRNAFFDLIPDSVIDIVMDLTLAFHQWSITFAEGVGVKVEDIARSLEWVNDIADEVTDTVAEGGEAISGVIGSIEKVAEPTAEILEEVNALAKAVIRGDYGNGATRIEKLGNKFKMVQNRVNELLGCTYVYEGALEEWLQTSDAVTESTEKMTDAQEENGEAVSRQSVIFANLVSVVKGVKAVLDIAWTTISSIARFVMDKITPGLAKVSEGLLGVGGTLGDLLERFAAFLKDNDLIYTALTTLHEAVQDKLGPAFESVGKFMDDLSMRKNDVLGFFEALDFSKIGKLDIQTFFKNLRTDAGSAIGAIGKLIISLGSGAAKLLGFNTNLEATEATFGAFNADDPRSGIGGFVQSLMKLGGGIGEKATKAVEGFGKAGAIIKEYWGMVIKGELTRSLRLAFIDFGKIFQLLGSDVNPIKEFYEHEWSFGKSAKVMGEFLGEVKEEVPILSTFAQLLNTFSGFFSFAWNIMKTVGTAIKNGLERWFQPMVDTLKNIVEKIKNADLDSLLQIGVLVTVLTTLITILNLARLAGNLFKSFSWVGDELYGLLRTMRLRSYAGIFLEFAISFGIIMFALAKVTQEFNKNSNGMWAAVASLVIIVAGLVGLLILIEKASAKADTMKSLAASGSLMILVGAIGLAMVELYALSKMEWGTIIDSLFKMGLVFIALVAMLAVVNLLFKKGGDNLPDWKKMAGFYAFVLALKTGAEILGELVGYSWDQIGKGLSSLFAIAVILTGLSYFMKNIKLTSSVGLIALVGAIWLFVKFLDAMKDYDFDGIYKSLEGLMPIFLLIGALGVLSGLAGKAFWSVAATLVGIAFAMRSIINAVTILGGMNANELNQGIQGLTLVLGVITGLTAALFSYMAFVDFYSAGGISRSGKQIVATFIGISVALLAVAAALKIMEKIDPSRFWPVVGALGGLMVALGILCALADKMRSSFTTLIGVAAVIVTIGLTLWGISAIPWKKLAAAAGALGTVLITLGVALWGLNSGGTKNPKKIGQTLLELIEVLAILAAVVFAIERLAKYDPKNLITAAAAIGILTIVLAAIAGMFGESKFTTAKWGNVTKGVVQKLAPIVGVIGLVITIAGALSLLCYVIGKYNVSWEQVAAAGVAVAVILGTVAAILIAVNKYKVFFSVTGGGFGATAKAIAEFGVFAAEIIGIIVIIGDLLYLLEEWTSKLNWFGGKGAISAAFDALAMFGYGIGEFFSAIGEGLTSRNPQMGENLSKYAKNLTDFIKVFGDASVDWNRIKESTDIINSIVTAMGPVSTQPFDAIKFNLRVTLLAQALKSFYEELNSEDINVYKAKTAAEAAEILAGITIQDTNGMSDDASNLEKLADGLGRIGRALIGFSQVVSSEDFDADAITSGMTAIQAVADVASKMNLSKFSGWDTLAGITSENKLTPKSKVGPNGLMLDFAVEEEQVSSLISLAETLKRLSDYVSQNEIKVDSVNQVIGCIGSLAEAAGKVPHEGGMWQEFAGGFSWSSISTGLTTLAFQIKQASVWGPEINKEGFEKVLGCIQSIGETAKGLEGVDTGVLQRLWSGDNSLAGLANALTSLTPNLKAFVDTFIGYDTASFGPAFAILRRVAGIPKMFTEEGYEGAGSFNLVVVGTQLEEFAESFCIFYEKLRDLAVGDNPVDDTAFQGILSLFSGMGELFTEDTLTQLKDIGTQLSASITEGFKINTVAVWDGVDSFISNLIGRIESEGNIQRMIDSGRRMSGKFADALHDGGDGKTTGSSKRLEEAADQVVKVVSNRLKSEDNYGRMKTAGAYLVQGLIDGMASKEGDLRAKAQSLADAVNAAFTIKESIESPSKVWFQFGSYLTEGLVNGMQATQDNAVYAAGALASAINGEFSNGLGPSITPVVDLSSAYGQASKLDTMFDTSRASAIAASMNINSQVTKMDQLVNMTSRILGAVQDGSDLYLDDGILAGRINRRLGVL